MSNGIEFTREKHIQYFVHCLKNLPTPYCKLDTNRLTLVHFAVQSLDLLNFFDDDNLLDRYQINKQHIIDWVYMLQTMRIEEHENESQVRVHVHHENVPHSHSGFKGGTFLGCKIQQDQDGHATPLYEGMSYDHGHLAMTYTALCTLITLGDDLSRVDRRGIINAMKLLQSSNGSFQCVPLGSEDDMRFLYCACCISYILDDWSGIDKDMAVEYIKACRSWDGAISLLPGQEGHGGSTFCAVASLFLLGRLEEVLDDEHDFNEVGGPQCYTLSSWRRELIQWCVLRQIDGMQGRPNKVEDTCYSYWIGGTLKILNSDDLLDKEALRNFIMCCQTDMGGFSKLKSASYYPDLLHSFYSMAWLSLSEYNGTGTGTEENVKSNNEDASRTVHSSKQDRKESTLSPVDCVLGMGLQRIEAHRECRLYGQINNQT